MINQPETLQRRSGSTDAASLLKAIVEASEDAIVSANRDAIITSWNPGAERMFGYDADEIIGQPIERIIPPELRSEEASTLERLNRGERLEHFHTIRLRKDGTRIDVSISTALLKDDHGEIIGAAKFIRDISRQKRDEAALREYAERFRNLADNISQLAWMADADGWIFWYNQRWFDYTGTTLEEMQGWGWQKVHHPDYVWKVVEKFRDCLARGVTWEDTFPLRAKDGTFRWFLSRAVPIRDPGGKIIRWFGTNTDVTTMRATEDALRKSEEQLTRTQSFSHVMTILVGLEGRILKAPPTLAELLGYPLGELLQKSLSDITQPDDFAFDWKQCLRLVNGEMKSFEMEKRLLPKSGGIVWVYCNTSIVTDENGKPLHFLTYIRDISAKKKADELMAQSELRLRELLQREADTRQKLELAMKGARIGTYEWDIVRNVHIWSEETERFFGYAPGEFPGTMEAVISRVHPDDRNVFATVEQMFTRKQEDHEFQYRALRPDGSVLWLVVRGRAFYGNSGEPIRILGVVVDITALKQAEESLRESEERFRATFDNAGVGVSIATPDGHFARVNTRYTAMLGYSHDEILAKTIKEITVPEDWPANAELLDKLSAGEIPWFHLEKRIRCKEGRIIWVNVTVSSVRDPATNQPAFFISVVEDITSRKRAEDEIRETREKLQLAIEASDLGIWDWKIPTNELVWSSRCRELFGFSADQAVSYDMFLNAVHPSDRERVVEAIERALRESTKYEVEMRVNRDDQPVRWLLANGRSFRNAAGEPVRMSGTVQDITDRKQAQQALQDREGHLRVLTEKMPAVPWSANAEGGIDYFTDKWIEWTGLPRDEAYGTGWMKVVHPDDLPQMAAAWENAIHHGAPYDVVHRIRQRDGNYRWSRSRALPQLDKEGRIVRWHGITDDIHEWKMAQLEVEELNEHLEQKVRERTAKLQGAVAELEHFSYTITHDMRAPLRAMRAFAEILLEEVPDKLDSEHKEYLDRIISSSQRMDNLIEDALNYSKIAREQFVLMPVDIDSLLRDITKTYPMFHPPQAEVSIIGRLPRVLATEAGMTQCFSNLLSNAVKFVKAGETPRVKVWAEVQGQFAKIWFEDNGIGIAPEYHEKIFGMFHKLNHDYDGTGIGLALVRKVVERMCGKIGVESQPGQGSRFWLHLRQCDNCEDDYTITTDDLCGAR